MPNMLDLLRAYLALDHQRKTDGLSPADMTRWSELKAALNRHFHPDVKEEHAQQRASVRVPLLLNVQFEALGNVRECLMTNLSTGGIFVATESPLPIGTPFNVRIKIERTGERVELPGEVVSVGVSADLSQERSGMGIRFVNLTPDQQAQVDEFYKAEMTKAVEKSPEHARADESAAIES